MTNRTKQIKEIKRMERAWGMGLETVLLALESAWGRRRLESLCGGRAWSAG